MRPTSAPASGLAEEEGGARERRGAEPLPEPSLPFQEEGDAEVERDEEEELDPHPGEGVGVAVVRHPLARGDRLLLQREGDRGARAAGRSAGAVRAGLRRLLPPGHVAQELLQRLALGRRRRGIGLQVPQALLEDLRSRASAERLAGRLAKDLLGEEAPHEAGLRRARRVDEEGDLGGLGGTEEGAHGTVAEALRQEDRRRGLSFPHGLSRGGFGRRRHGEERIGREPRHHGTRHGAAVGIGDEDRDLRRVLLPRSREEEAEERGQENRRDDSDDHGAPVGEEELQLVGDDRQGLFHRSSLSACPVRWRKTSSRRGFPPSSPGTAMPRAARRAIAARASASSSGPLARGKERPQLVGRPVGHDPAVVDDDDPVAEALGLFHVVRRVEDRLPRVAQRLEAFEDGVAALRVDARRRLVEQKDVRVVEKPGREVQTALHPAAVGLHAVAPPVGEAREAEDVVDPGGEARAFHAPGAPRRTGGCRPPRAPRRGPAPAARGRDAPSPGRCPPPGRPRRPSPLPLREAEGRR